jgi:hypothetical protein
VIGQILKKLLVKTFTRPDFIDKMLIGVLLIFIFSLVHPFLFGGRLIVNEFKGDSMNQTIAPGNIVVWLQSKDVQLQPGDIGCYNDAYVAKEYNLSKFVQCHHVNATGEGLTIFHTDKYCIEPDDERHNEFCRVYESVIPNTDIEGKFLWNVGSKDMLMIAFVAFIAMLWVIDRFFKDDYDDSKKLVRSVPTK